MTDNTIQPNSVSGIIKLDSLATSLPLKEFYPSSIGKSFTDYFSGVLEIYQSLPLPGRKDEAWRRTPLNDLDLSSFSVEPSPKKPSIVKMLPEDTTISGAINLTIDATTCAIEGSLTNSGVIFCDLATAMRDHSQYLSQKLGKVVPASDGKFAALTSSLATKGAFLYIPKGKKVKKPFKIKISQTKPYLADFFHLLIWLDDGSSAEVSIEMESPDLLENTQAFTGGILEIDLGCNASLDVTEIQNLSKDVWLFTHERARIAENARLNWIYGGLGSCLTKSFIGIDLIGKNADAKVGGFFVGNGKQHLDFDTQQNHFAPGSKSDLLFRGVVKGQSHSVWQGMIYVAKDAISSDGYQKSNNLVLSKQARASAIPGLEILNNDVSCSHGVTVSKLSQEELFYLETRGIDAAEGEKLLLKGFYTQILDMIKNKEVQKRFENLIDLCIS